MAPAAHSKEDKGIGYDPQATAGRQWEQPKGVVALGEGPSVSSSFRRMLWEQGRGWEQFLKKILSSLRSQQLLFLHFEPAFVREETFVLEKAFTGDLSRHTSRGSRSRQIRLNTGMIACYLKLNFSIHNLKLIRHTTYLWVRSQCLDRRKE
jgi:hypothetical protein